MEFDSLKVPPRLRRIVIEGGILVMLGIVMGVLGPYGSGDASPAQRYVYWLAAIVFGGGMGIAIDRALSRSVLPLFGRVIFISLAMTPPVMLLVEFLNAFVMRYPVGWHDLGELAWRVFVVSLLVMMIRALFWRPPAVVIEQRTVVTPPLPEAEALFRRRLPARFRTARLIALEAHDHYLKVHTDAGCEMITARFSDALDELAQAYGYRTHRSWWVAADAIEAVRWSRGTGSAQLSGGIVAPVSRTQAMTLREAGW